MQSFVVSLHDVHPGSFAAFRAQREHLASLGVDRVVLLVIPDYHQHGALTDDPALCAWLRERQAAGDEIVLHGYHHLRVGESARRGNVFWTQLYTANEAEFLDLSHAEAASWLARGRSVLEQAGLVTDAFIAPAWLLGDEARRAVWDAGFERTTTIRDVIWRDGRTLSSQSLCWSTRAAWRRTVSLAWNAWLWSRVRHGPLIRLALHPRDLEFPALARQVDDILTAARIEGMTFTTYQRLA
jgi:predicted deacetylase